VSIPHSPIYVLDNGTVSGSIRQKREQEREIWEFARRLWLKMTPFLLKNDPFLLTMTNFSHKTMYFINFCDFFVGCWPFYRHFTIEIHCFSSFLLIFCPFFNDLLIKYLFFIDFYRFFFVKKRRIGFGGRKRRQLFRNLCGRSVFLFFYRFFFPFTIHFSFFKFLRKKKKKRLKIN
jgi:hypothetical protein